MTCQENLTIRSGRLDAGEMAAFLDSQEFDIVINATHPYAIEAEKNIRSACEKTKTEYIRLLRNGENTEYGHHVGSIDEAVEYLGTTTGNIFITTGAKELSKYTAINNYKERAYVRILPFEESLAIAKKSGFPGNKIIAMQGPFSEELNAAMLKTANAKYLVTKEGGKEGGFYDKISAAKRVGAEVVVIGRKHEQHGISYAETIDFLVKRYDIRVKQQVVIIGIGPGSRENLTLEALDAIKNSDAIIGSERAIGMFGDMGKQAFTTINPNKIIDIIKENPWLSTFAVLMAGDTGFYSGAKKLTEKLKDARIICGVSSVSYFCAKLGISWDDIKLLSLHGRTGGLIHTVKNNIKTMALVGGTDGVNKLAQELCRFGYRQSKLTIGERLSYPDEQISTGLAHELVNSKFDSLSVVLIENQAYKNLVSYGLADDEFTRGDIPMTKSEIRSVIMSKIRLSDDSVVYDIGAGTGSVAVEMAVAACFGDAYAIEKNPAAIPLIEANKHKFGLPNLHVIEGTAPQAMACLPAPTHAFIGGSSGNMQDIVSALVTINKHVRMVITAITLETVHEVMLCAKEFNFKEFEAVHLSVGRSKKIGGYNMMMGQNPVYIFTMQNPSREE